MSRESNNRKLARDGFRQGDADACRGEAVPCGRCGGSVSGARSWWRHPEGGDPEPFCRLCALICSRSVMSGVEFSEAAEISRGELLAAFGLPAELVEGGGSASGARVQAAEFARRFGLK